ncbi:FGGY family carbohydrate kinase [Nonomuraea sp. NPDC050310]|uniref:FGGY-family carbohydrate kinase n=1 Tax=Nonomuraea sp. NPDC050310 TaxID=3154935 RepID=UPI0033E64412
MTVPAVLGVDIGTSSSKGVLVGLDGTLLRTAVREHAVDRPIPGHVEMDGRVWWTEFVSLARELGQDAEVRAVGVSGMGPCVLLADADDVPVRPAVLYGVDTRSTAQIARLESELGAEEIRRLGGSDLSSQAAGAKIAWVADEEPELFARARRLFMPSSWLVRRLTGEYVLDHHSASQCTPLYDVGRLDWHGPWAERIAPGLDLPPLRWPGEVAGKLSMQAARETDLPAGVPVITGTIDAWAEALSVGAHEPGDLMLMYGTTMFLIHTAAEHRTWPGLWGTVGALPGTYNLAGGMATSGAITAWLRELVGAGYEELLHEAAGAGRGANGLLMLPYFAGERTPVMDPRARGVIVGLSLSHTRGDLYRAALEATGFAVRHNIETIRAAGGDIRRVVAVGGGTQGGLWTRIVSDITGLPQHLRATSIGASYGSAFLAAQAVGPAEIDDWNPVREEVVPQPEAVADYDRLYRLYQQLYPSTASLAHELADRQLR